MDRSILNQLNSLVQFSNTYLLLPEKYQRKGDYLVTRCQQYVELTKQNNDKSGTSCYKKTEELPT